MEVIQFLIETVGADSLRVRDNEGRLALHCLCATKPNLDVVKYVCRSYPPAVATRTRSGVLPLAIACEAKASESVIYELLRASPDALLGPF